MKMIRLLIKVSLIRGGLLLLGFVALLPHVLYTQHCYAAFQFDSMTPGS
jgi:hypothetical protein